MIKRLCVFCGSSPYTDPKYYATAEELAQLLVTRGIGLVYGGSNIGTMKVIADCVLNAGGDAIGVMPQILVDKEIAHPGLTELHIVGSMHARKSMMAALSDGFIAMPGGFGTLEEIIEIITWGQLRFHDKPCGLLNVDGYFDYLLAYLDHASAEGFLRPENRQMLLCDRSAAGLIQKFEHYTAPHVDKWTG